MYKIINSGDLATLEKAVNEYLNRGYELVGALQSYIYYDYEPVSDRTIHYNYFYQALIKK